MRRVIIRTSFEVPSTEIPPAFLFDESDQRLMTASRAITEFPHIDIFLPWSFAHLTDAHLADDTLTFSRELWCIEHNYTLEPPVVHVGLLYSLLQTPYTSTETVEC